MNICIVIPAYNEEKTINKVVESCILHGKVLVINDGSTDKTKSIARAAGAEVFSNVVRKGYDISLIKGIKKALELKQDFIITIDADNQHPISSIPTFLNYLHKKKYILAIGSRTYFPRVSEKIFNFYSQIFHNIPDILCGMKAYSSEYLVSINIDKLYRSVGTYLTLEASRKKKEIKNIEIKVNKRNYGEARFGSGLYTELKVLRALFYCIICDIKNKMYKIFL